MAEMSRIEIATANEIVSDSYKAMELIAKIHRNYEKLLDLGWDADTWCISEAAMKIGKEALGIAQTIANESEVK